MLAEVCANSRASEILVDNTSLQELAQIFTKAQFIVGNDTGPTFLAARIGVPTLMIMEPIQTPHIVTNRARNRIIYKANIQEITTQEVIKKVQELGGLSLLK